MVRVPGRSAAAAAAPQRLPLQPQRFLVDDEQLGLKGTDGGSDDVLRMGMPGVDLDGQRQISSLVRLIMPGMRTKSICSGKGKRPAMGEPVPRG